MTEDRPDSIAWTDTDQKRVDTFASAVLEPLFAADDPHMLFVMVHGFLQAVGHAIRHDLEQRPELAEYYVLLCDRLREHVARATTGGRNETLH